MYSLASGLTSHSRANWGSIVDTPVSGEMVVRFSHMGRKGRCPLLVANQGR